MIRIAAKTSLPEHYELANLRPPYRAAGWISTLVGLFGAVALAASGGASAEIGAALAVLVAAVSGYLNVKCSRHEIVVGSLRTEFGAGPFRHTLASRAIESTVARPATGWRKLFAAHEVVVVVTVRGRVEHALPTDQPDRLIAVLRSVGE